MKKKIDYNERLKNPMRTVKHGVDSIDCHCRACSFSGFGKENIVKKARYHCEKTGHTVDVYRSNWTEITRYKKQIKI